MLLRGVHSSADPAEAPLLIAGSARARTGSCEDTSLRGRPLAEADFSVYRRVGTVYYLNQLLDSRVSGRSRSGPYGAGLVIYRCRASGIRSGRGIVLVAADLPLTLVSRVLL